MDLVFLCIYMVQTWHRRIFSHRGRLRSEDSIGLIFTWTKQSRPIQPFARLALPLIFLDLTMVRPTRLVISTLNVTTTTHNQLRSNWPRSVEGECALFEQNSLYNLNTFQ